MMYYKFHHTILSPFLVILVIFLSCLRKQLSCLKWIARTVWAQTQTWCWCRDIVPVLSFWQKPSAAAAKPTGTKAAAKSRLAAAKAAMKAKQQAAAAETQPQAEPQPADSVVFDGGFFQVESPAKPTGERKITFHQRFFKPQCFLVYIPCCFSYKIWTTNHHTCL